MVNDLTTLSGALVECKDQLISELADKGVTATYDPTTGLLGLISHIADIQGGEVIVLTTNKNILSYADSETATLTAVHNGGSGKSLAIYNAVSGAKIGDMTDNGDGTYSYTYSATGTGDISMTCATTTLESNSITIHDYFLYDPTTANNTSRYTTQSGLTFTFDTDHYIIRNDGSGTRTITKTWTTPVNAFKLEMDIYITNNRNNTQLYLTLLNNSQNNIRTRISPIDNMFGLDDSITEHYVGLANFQKNKWYHLVTEYNSITGGTANLYDGDTLMYSVTNTSLSFTNLNTFTITNLWDSGAINWIKNIKIIQPQTLTLTTNKEVLSYYDNEYATLTATHTDGTTGLNVAVYNAVSGTKIGDMTDNNDGTYTYTYSSTGVGDISMTAVSGVLESNAISIEDCLRYDAGNIDKTSSYGSIIDYRGSGTGTWNYDSTNGYYGTITSEESMITLTELTGLDTFTLEFDALFNSTDISNWYGIAGICAYNSTGNYSRLSAFSTKLAQRICTNGSCSESEENQSGIYRGDTVHFKFEVNNGQIKETVSKNNTTTGTKIGNYTATSTTQYGIAFIWNKNVVRDTYYTNIKVKV